MNQSLKFRRCPEPDSTRQSAPVHQSAVHGRLTANSQSMDDDQSFRGAPIDDAGQMGTDDSRDAGRQPAAGPVAWLLKQLLSRCGNPPLRVVLPGGQEIVPPGVNPLGTLRFADQRTILAVAVDPMFQFAEAYSKGRLEIDGNLPDVLSALYRHMNHGGPGRWPGQLLGRLRPASSNNLRRSRENIHHHYDIGNDFYQLWLDEQMIYTCAYYAQPAMTLEQAQHAKMDHVCRKLRLQPGMTVVEAGCGWGALAMHMAKHFGVNVRACNISQEQIAWARQRASGDGLDDRVEFVADDWRNIRGQYDAFVSVGMLEHVGRKNYRRLGETISGCLKPDGLGLIHTIGQNAPRQLSPWIERRIFPGAHPPSMAQMMEIFESNGLSVLDVENLRLHYATTLRHWLDRFEAAVDRVRARFGERFVRMWRFYLSGSAASFESGSLQVFQVLFASELSNRIPQTRNDIYAEMTFR